MYGIGITGTALVTPLLALLCGATLVLVILVLVGVQVGFDSFIIMCKATLFATMTVAGSGKVFANFLKPKK